LIHDVARFRRIVFDRALRRAGLTRTQLWVLKNGAQAGRSGLSQTALSGAMNLGKVSFGCTLDRLEASGHVRRLQHDYDRRIRVVVATPRGLQHLARVSALADAIERQLEGHSLLQDIEITERVFEKMKVRLVAMQERSDEADSAIGAT
jgi:MarR family transcriptional regulator for hemolysin